MYGYVYVCIDMYVCMHHRIDVRIIGCLCVNVYACMLVCIFVRDCKNIFACISNERVETDLERDGRDVKATPTLLGAASAGAPEQVEVQHLPVRGMGSR